MESTKKNPIEPRRDALIWQIFSKPNHLGFPAQYSLRPNSSECYFSFSYTDNTNFAQSNSLLCSLQHFEVLKEHVNRNAFTELKCIVISLKTPIIIQLRTIYHTSNCFPKEAITSALHVTFSTGLISQLGLCWHGGFPLRPKINTVPYCFEAPALARQTALKSCTS